MSKVLVFFDHVSWFPWEHEKKNKEKKNNIFTDRQAHYPEQNKHSLETGLFIFMVRWLQNRFCCFDRFVAQNVSLEVEITPVFWFSIVPAQHRVDLQLILTGLESLHRQLYTALLTTPVLHTHQYLHT